MVGETAWNDNEWIKVFKNLIKIGLSYNIGVIFLALSQGFESLQFFQILIRIQEDLTPFMILPLKFEKWQASAFELLKYFLLQGPVNTTLINKVLTKFSKTIIEIYNVGFLSFTDELIIFFSHLKEKYAQSSMAQEIEKEFEYLIKTTNLNPDKVINKKYTISSWTTPKSSTNLQQQLQQPNKIKYRGLLNLGNSIISFSFI